MGQRAGSAEEPGGLFPPLGSISRLATVSQTGHCHCLGLGVLVPFKDTTQLDGLNKALPAAAFRDFSRLRGASQEPGPGSDEVSEVSPWCRVRLS